MQQYFIKGQVENPVTIKDKDTVKHMFNAVSYTHLVILKRNLGIDLMMRLEGRSL